MTRALLGVLLALATACSPTPYAFHATGRPVVAEMFPVETCPVHDEALTVVQVEMLSGMFYVEPPLYAESRASAFPYARGLVHGAFDGTVYANRCERCTRAEREWLKTRGQR